MRISADTNLLVRIIANDDPDQARTAGALLRDAELVAISLPCMCEFSWVLEKVYQLSRSDIAFAIREIVGRANVVADHGSVATGLRMLDAGGDFADGAIAASGAMLGGEVFVSFDRKAVKRSATIGVPARDARDFA
jgi:predicted nucleic-acid-binding protein